MCVVRMRAQLEDGVEYFYLLSDPTNVVFDQPEAYVGATMESVLAARSDKAQADKAQIDKEL